MFNEMNILGIYNTISDKTIDKETFFVILPKLHIILTNFNLDYIEIIDLIDTLLIFKENNLLKLINEESIKLLVKITDSKDILEKSLYFPLVLKHLLLPVELNKCEEEYEIMLFLSEFEMILELINKKLSQQELDTLKKYNTDLYDLSCEYKKIYELYQNHRNYNLIINTIFSHLASMYYFNQNEYDKNISLLSNICDSLIENKIELFHYLISEGTLTNFNKIYLKTEELFKEYRVCKKMIDYEYNQQKKDEKRKCK